MLGAARLFVEPDGKTGEIVFGIADPWQGLGLGSKLVDYIIEISKDKKLETIYAVTLPNNYRAIRLMKNMGFTLEFPDEGTVKATLNLKEELESQGVMKRSLEESRAMEMEAEAVQE
jgi:acetyltransferase